MAAGFFSSDEEGYIFMSVHLFVCLLNGF